MVLSMKARHRHLIHRGRTSRGLPTDLGAVDAQWEAYHRYVFLICAKHLSPTDELGQFALVIADSEELTGLATHILTRKEELNLRPDAIADIESVAGAGAVLPADPAAASATADPGAAEVTHATTAAPAPVPNATSAARLRQLFSRVVGRNDSIQSIAVDYILDAAGIAPECPPFPEIVHDVASLFSLSDEHVRILLALFAVDDIEVMSNMLHKATHRTQMKILADVAGIDLAAFAQQTAPGSNLERLGLIVFRGGRDEISDINISRPLLFTLRSNTLDDLQAGFFDETPSPQFELSQFSVPPEEIRNCVAAVRGGHPLLIAGEPGIGKTEFVRTLIAALDRNAHTLAATNRHSDFSKGPRGGDNDGGRFNAIRMAVNILSPDRDVLIIDEADAILQSAAGFFGLFGGALGGGSYDKAVLNDLLENLPVATIWITNDHRMIPASAVRRFGHVFAFPHPTVDTRVRMLSERLSPLTGGSSDTWTRDLAAGYDITPAAIDRTARIIAAELDALELNPADVRNRVTGYIEQISTGALAHDVRRLPTVSPTFDPRFCSTSESLDRVERQALRRAQARSGLRLLFGGPPGGGKTQYALWLARRLGRDVVLKRPSDLLSKYVGQSEQQIAEAFRTAARAGSVLVIDEADALLYDRSIAQRSWEHSQIAEFLQQIQEYTGILVACTNRVDAVDPALRRRFHKHVTFGPISEEVLRPALAHIFPDVTFTPADLAALRNGPPLMMSDLATAAEMIEIDTFPDESDRVEATVSSATVAEEILAGARSRDRTREIGF